MYTIKTGTQYEPEVPTLFEAKIEAGNLLDTLDKNMIYVYLKDVLVMIVEKINGAIEYHKMYADDNVYYGMIHREVNI